MPELTPEVRAEQIVDQWINNHPGLQKWFANDFMGSHTATAKQLKVWITEAFRAVEQATWEKAYKLLCADCRTGTPLTNKSGKSWGDCWVHLDGKVQLGICGADVLRRRATGGTR